MGCLAHGGLGWIYLARDKAVNDRWVVLKGLLDSGDQAAMAVAVAERRFLAELDHPAIVVIYNFITDRGAGYIVMEYIGGRSLKQILAVRRAANGGDPDPLPVDQAIAFVLAILPAFTYLHGRGLLYCDFKPDNLLQVGDEVRLIDVGAVRRFDDTTSAVYGTVGFQAPEIADMGPSVASDVYTIGRTLAVLTLDFRGYQTKLQYEMPDPADHPVLARFDSFHRLLLKATAAHPDDRFQTVAELGEQMTGVLREHVALTTGRPQAVPSGLFGPVPDDDTGLAALPPLAVDASDPAAAFLASVGAGSPEGVVRDIDTAVALAQVPVTVEVRLRRAQALIDLGDHASAAVELDRVEEDDPWEWRAVWLRGVSALVQGQFRPAAAAFDRCRSEVPGELAPKLAAAAAAEGGGRPGRGGRPLPDRRHRRPRLRDRGPGPGPVPGGAGRRGRRPGRLRPHPRHPPGPRGGPGGGGAPRWSPPAASSTPPTARRPPRRPPPSGRAGGRPVRVGPRALAAGALARPRATASGAGPSTSGGCAGGRRTPSAAWPASPPTPPSGPQSSTGPTASAPARSCERRRRPPRGRTGDTSAASGRVRLSPVRRRRRRRRRRAPSRRGAAGARVSRLRRGVRRGRRVLRGVRGRPAAHGRPGRDRRGRSPRPHDEGLSVPTDPVFAADPARRAARPASTMVEGYCGVCGMKQPAARDHMEATRPTAWPR